MALFEGYERKIEKINGVLAQYGLKSVEECREMCTAKGFDPYEIVKGIQPIAFAPIFLILLRFCISRIYISPNKFSNAATFSLSSFRITTRGMPP